VALLGRLLIITGGFPIIPRYTLTGRVLGSQHKLRFGIAPIRRIAQPQQRLLGAGRDLWIGGIQHPKLKLRIGIALHAALRSHSAALRALCPTP
jgi:hypothetical protein